jgi:hypothetical protein
MEKPNNLLAICTRIGCLCRSIALTCGLWLVPLAVWAQDADEAPTPMDPQTAALQRRMFAIIAGAIVLGGGWYWLRRWQITRGGQKIESRERDTND